MKTVCDWLDEYSQNHKNALNRKFHIASIPPIVFSVVCALKAIPFGNAWLNPASITVVVALVYYWLLSWRLTIGVLVALAMFYAAALIIQSAVGPNLIWVAIAIFIMGWIGQYAGHMAEGSRPSFYKDLQFLLIGPLWELAQLYRRLGIPIGDEAKRPG